METVQILLVGGRQVPNVIGSMELHPQYVDFLVSQDEINRVNTLVESLAGIEGLNLPDKKNLEIVDAYDYQANVDACKRLCAKHANKRIQFNLTGSTKIMAFAAYDIAHQFQKEAFYVNTAKGQIVWLLGNHKASTPFRLTIEEYLRTYGRQPQLTFDFSRLTFGQLQAIEAARLLARLGPDAINLLYQIRRVQGKGVRRVTFNRATTKEQKLIDDLAKIGVIDKEQNAFLICSNEDWNFFKGDWLEIYVWDEARQQMDKEGRPLFDECELSLEIPSEAARKEIDVACLYQAQLIHCSCKTDRKSFETAYLDELRAVSSLIGGRFCSRVFITNAIFTAQEQKDKFLAQATQREIIVITGDNLKDLGGILAKQAIKPDFWRV